MNRGRRWVFVLAVFALAVGIGTAAPVDTEPAEPPATLDVLTDPPPLGLDDCAAEPPDDFEPPEEDVLGWHDGYWYNQPIDVDTDGGLTEDELDAVVARSMARWEALRCLPFEDTVSVEVIDRETFQAEHTGANVSAETRLFENARALSLFMAGHDEDAVALREANRGETVGGFYDIGEGKIVLVSGEDGEIHVNEPILGHELGHALQDQHFGLEGYAGATTDDHNANLGIVEGDVVFTDTVYEGHCRAGAWAGDCVMPPTEREPPDLASIGLYLIAIQPYSDGPNFAATLYEAGGWEAVNAVYDEYPPSSKAVMYPELYPDFDPDHPPLDDTSTDEWTRLERSSGIDYDHLGEPVLFASLIAPGMGDLLADSVIDPLSLFNEGPDGQLDPLNPYNYTHEYTSGWVGDRFVAYAEAGVDPDDDPQLAYTLDVAFEDEAGAAAFHDAWVQQLELHGAIAGDGADVYTINASGSFDGAYYVDQTGDTVSVVHAPTVEDLGSVEAALRDEEEDPAGADRIPGYTVTIAVIGLFGTVAVIAWRRR